MKISLSHKSKRSGFALLLVLFTLVAMIMVFSSTMMWMSSSVKQTAKNSVFTTSQAAAEGATEVAFAEMDRDFLLNVLQSGSSYDQLLPNQTGWPMQFTFSDTNGNTGQISVNEGTLSSALQPLGTEYASLEGYIQTVTVTATATPQSQLYNQPATVQQQFTFAYVPAFQFAIFYNINLEIDPGATMPITGSVFSNGGIWSGDSNPTYSSTVEAAGQVNLSGTDPFLLTYTNTGGTPQSNFTYPNQPVHGVTPLEIPIGAGTNNSETNVIAIIQIPPSSVCAPQPAAYAQTNQVYKYNQASLVVSNWSSGTFSNAPNGNNFVVYLQDSWTGPSWHYPSTGHFNQLTNNLFVVTNNVGNVFSTITTSALDTLPGFTTSALPAQWPLVPTANCGITWTTTSSGTNYHWGVKYAGWSFLTNVSFYDYRESSTVQAVQIDVSMLRSWITNAFENGGSNWNYALAYDGGKGIDSVYVFNGVPLTSTTLPAVRLINGIRLPNSTNVINNTNNITYGLSVATAQPIYVYGDYNLQIDGDASTRQSGTNDMSHTYPAGFLADAVTILSGSWRDSYTSSTSLTGRTPSSTAVNAAMLEGIVQSSTNAPNISGVTGYSGGVENFMRLLENWSNYTLTYNGSIMVMFSSQYATNWWQNTGNYYNAPTRVWSFDTNFETQAGLPPMTPEFTTVIRSNYNAF